MGIGQKKETSFFNEILFDFENKIITETDNEVKDEEMILMQQ